MMKRFALMVLLTLVIGACSPSPTPIATPSKAADNPASATKAPSPTPIPPTATAVPPTNTPLPSATPTLQAYGPDNFPTDVNPLTGKVISDPELLNRHPLSVKIQTFPRGQRPPWGVSLADLVFDYYQNNGLTRLNAIFYGNDADQVGPIRSARLLDGSLTQMYKSIFAFGGADQRILNRLFNSNYSDRLVVEGSQDCPPMCRTDPNGYNFLVTNTANLTTYAASKGVKTERQDLNGMSFDPIVPSDGQPGGQLYTRYSISAYVRWDYDPATGRYLRFEDTQEDNTGGSGEGYAPFIDRLNNEQVAADNVVVLKARHDYFWKNGSSEIVDIALTGSGEAYAFRNGQYYKVTWNRPTADSVLYLTNPDGTPFPFKPGTTWFQVIGQDSKVASDNAIATGSLRFTSTIP